MKNNITCQLAIFSASLIMGCEQPERMNSIQNESCIKKLTILTDKTIHPPDLLYEFVLSDDAKFKQNIQNITIRIAIDSVEFVPIYEEFYYDKNTNLFHYSQQASLFWSHKKYNSHEEFENETLKNTVLILQDTNTHKSWRITACRK